MCISRWSRAVAMACALPVTVVCVITAPTNAADNLMELLLGAISKGDTASVERLLAQGVDLDANEIAMAALGRAASAGPEMVKLLVAHGVDPNIRQPLFGTTVLMELAGRKDEPVEEINALIAGGANVNAKQDLNAWKEAVAAEGRTFEEDADTTGWTALTVAAASLHSGATRALLSAGADAHVKDAHHRTPLTVASMNAYDRDAEGTLQALLGAGADANVVDDKHWTPLMYAARSGNPAAVTVLIEHGAEVSAKNALGETAVMITEKYGQAESGEENGRFVYYSRQRHRQVFDALVAKSRRDASGPDAHTALLLAVRNGDTNAVEHLLASGADPNAGEGTILRTGARLGRTSAVEVLLAHGAKVDTPDESGWTPLMYAADCGQLEAARALLAHGADVHATDHGHHFTPLIYASAEGHAAVAGILLDSGANPSLSDGGKALTWAVWSGHADTVKELLNHRIRASGEHLFTAAMNGHTDMIEPLIAAGADVHAQVTGGYIYGNTPLQEAAANGHLAVLELLIAHGAGTNQSDIDQALAYAADRSRVQVVEFLLRHGANANGPASRFATGAPLPEVRDLLRRAREHSDE